MRLTITRPSIARRLLVALLIAYLFVWLVVVGIAASSLYTSGGGDFDREMTGLAQVIDAVSASRSVPLSTALHGLSLKLDEDGRRAGIPGAHLGFRVFDEAGRTLASGGAPTPALADDGRRDFFEINTEQGAWRVLRHVSQDRARRIDVAQAPGTRMRIMQATLFNAQTLVQLLVGFPLLWLPIWLAVHTGLAPLLRLSQALSSRQPGELELINIGLPQRELTPLTDALNATLSRLSALLHRERTFLADAAHELRTSLGVISAQYDTLSRVGLEQFPDALRRANLGITRSVRLVNQLLALARLEADIESSLSHVDLADIVRDCLAMHGAAAAAERGVELSYLGCDSLTALCLVHAVETVVHNLVSNAIHHGGAGGQVEVALYAIGEEELQISVSDDGPGMSVKERELVFERFWRGSDSKNQAQGSGLGMAIVLAASRQLNGRIELDAGLEGKGLRVTLTWPRLKGIEQQAVLGKT